jgi:sugar porter (SP) family MFS transporter
MTGTLADRFSRKWTIFMAVVVFCVGVIIQATANAPNSIFAGRFVVGLGVGAISMAVPLYNAELSPPEVRGSLVSLQQLAIVFGILVSFWIDYGTNFIGLTATSQSEAAWRIPLALQIVPALILGVGVVFMPYSPRWLINQGRDEEALRVLSRARQLDASSDLVQIEYLEIKAEYLFEKEIREEKYPQYQDGSFSSELALGFHTYASLLSNRTLFWRVAVGAIVMFFQQWTGINAILYYAPTIFGALGLTGNTLALLATGVVGITMFIATIPSVIWVDSVGRKPILISGAFIMGACHLIVGILTSQFQSSWGTHAAAGWAACALVWVFAAAFGYSWGPCAWVLISEIFPLSARGKGMSIAASSNWMNNFIVGQVTPTMIKKSTVATFIVFSAFSFLGGAFVWVFVPETKGLTLEEMDDAFGVKGGSFAVADLERHRAISARIGLDRFAGLGADNADRESVEKKSV